MEHAVKSVGTYANRIVSNNRLEMRLFCVLSVKEQYYFQ